LLNSPVEQGVVIRPHSRLRTVLCLFQGPSRAAVIQASERLGIPSERLTGSTWLGPDRPAREGAQECPDAMTRHQDEE
jgi:hypothetical protein